MQQLVLISAHGVLREALSCRAKNNCATVCGHGHQEVTGVFHPLSESAFGRSLCLKAPNRRVVV